MFETALLPNPPAGSLQMVIESTVPPGGGSWYILMAERKAQIAGPQLKGQADTHANMLMQHFTLMSVFSLKRQYWSL